MKIARTFATLLALLSLGVSPASAQSKPPARQPVKATKKMAKKAVRMIAYDAKDKKYYSVAWAKAHGMHDKGGDKLIIIPKSKLPKGAKMSRAMRSARQ